MTITLPVVMTDEIAKALRAPFAPEHTGKLPRVTCPACRANKREKVCEQHRKVRCEGCRNYITSAHLHLDYVGHAEVTDRLLIVDPLWTWAPMAFDDDGLPKMDKIGGLWINLTVAGVTRPGYGSAKGENGPGDAVKEIIGDAIRNAAMRFGVALDLWGAKFKDAEADAEAVMRESVPGADVDVDDWENATPVHGRGIPPAEPQQPHVPARPVDQGPPAAAYNAAFYPLGVQRLDEAETLAELDVMAGNIETFAATGQITPAEAGRLRMKLGNRRDELRKAPPPALPDAIAQNALETAQH